MVQLIDLTGRIVRHDKRGAIDLSLSPILQRLGTDSENWIEIATKFEENTHGVAGQTQSMKQSTQSKTE
ncbi:hypothetical protein [Marinomonas sp. 2405UD68-3]|uniref:hypothetical protein n=1 Tax=Marinomonas sp. 2405UD68-3 TaxID=3391835 RepID=UPI0039C8F6A1